MIGERGDGPIGLLVAASVFLLGATTLVSAALGYYARQVISAAAQDGAIMAATLDGNSTDGAALVDRLIADAGSSLIDGWSTTTAVEEDETGRRRVVMVVRAEVIGPVGRWPIEARGSAPIEEFVPQAVGE